MLTLDSWLNEGWTTYLERRLQAAVHGEAHRDFSAIIGWTALSNSSKSRSPKPLLKFFLEESVDRFGDDHEFTKLVIDLKGKDPDDAFSSIPYEKVTFPTTYSTICLTLLGVPLSLLPRETCWQAYL